MSKLGKEAVVTLIATGVSVSVSVILSAYESKLDKWIDKEYHVIEDDLYGRLEVATVDMDVYMKEKARDVLCGMVKRFFSAPTKNAAKRTLEKMKMFVLELEKVDADIPRIIMEYYAKFVDVTITTKQYSIADAISRYSRY